MPPKRKAESGTAAPSASKGKVPKAAENAAIPVDTALVERGQLIGAAVWRDYAYLGNQVDIANNNNKFYRGQVLVVGSKYYSWTRWGRVGENGQSSLIGPSSEGLNPLTFVAVFCSTLCHGGLSLASFFR